MRKSIDRTRKYDKKIKGMILPGQKESFAAKVGRQVEIEKIVNAIVKSNINRVYYIIFGKEVFKLIGKHKDETLDTEIEILQNKWKARGLSETLLASIKEAVGYIRVPAPPIGVFRLDISQLDGPDVLS